MTAASDATKAQPARCPPGIRRPAGSASCWSISARPTAPISSRCGAICANSCPIRASSSSARDLVSDPLRPGADHAAARSPAPTTPGSGTASATNRRCAPFTRAQGEKLAAALADLPEVVVDWAMRYGNPSTASVGRQADRRRAATASCRFPLYPQYSATTTATANDQLFRALMKMRRAPAVRSVPPYYDEPVYIDALARSIEKHLATLDFEPEVVIASYHGIPKPYFEKGDPYHGHCLETTRLLRERLGWSEKKLITTFQSRFGAQEWLQPYTDKTVEKLAQDGVKSIAVVNPGFSVDCIETLDEIGRRGGRDLPPCRRQEFRPYPLPQRQRRGHGGDRGDGAARIVRLGLKATCRNNAAAGPLTSAALGDNSCPASSTSEPAGRSGPPTARRRCPPRALTPRHQNRRADRRHGHQRRHDGRGADGEAATRWSASTGAARSTARPPQRPRSSQFEIDQPLTMLSKMIGHTAAEQAWRRSRLAVANLAARIAELGISCDASPAGQSLYLAGNVLRPGRVARRGRCARVRPECMRHLSLARTAQQNSFGIERRRRILSHGNLALDPRKLTAGLLLKALERKARLYAPVEATAIDKTQRRGHHARQRRPGDHGRASGAGDGLRADGHRARGEPCHHLDLGDRDAPQSRNIWPGEAFDLGSVGPLSLHARDGRRPRRLRRRGRGFHGRGPGATP